jgi:uncharacterized protein
LTMAEILGPSVDGGEMPLASASPAAEGVLADELAELCAACGMCCNGVLFGSVAVENDAGRMALALQGFQFERSGRGWRFRQPCPARTGEGCRVYALRPGPCRVFVCRLLGAVADRRLIRERAATVIRETRQMVRQMRTLLRQLGNQDESAPLSQRYRACLERRSERDPEYLETLGELIMAVNTLNGQLRQYFHLPTYHQRYCL